MSKRSMFTKISAMLLSMLLLVSCTQKPSDTDAVSDAETTADAVTEAEVVEDFYEDPDGVFETPTRLAGFKRDKNKSFLKGRKCDIWYNDNGSLTLSATVSAGDRYVSEFEIYYAAMMKNCYSSYTSVDLLPNGGDEKYQAIVFDVESEGLDLSQIDLSAFSGRGSDKQNTVVPTVYKRNSSRAYLIFDMGTFFDEAHMSKFVFTWIDGTYTEEKQVEMKLNSIEIFRTMDEAYKAIGMENGKKDEFGNYPLNISSDKLNGLIKNIFSGDTVKNETVMFLDAGDEKELLFDIDKIISVTSYDGKVTYTEGKDYEVRDGKLVALQGGKLPIITRERYYGANSSSLLKTTYNGQSVYTHWGEGQIMTNWQVNVTYTHKDAWDGFDQACEAEIYADFIKKLQNGEDVTVIFYGDSCTYGAASSFAYGYAPYQYSYALLVTQALADMFGYTVKYIPANLPETGPIPEQDYVAGTNGVITYINPSVGGWSSAAALQNTDKYLVPFIEKYGCDLFVCDIGGNDGKTQAETTRENIEGIINKVIPLTKDDLAVCIMSTLVNNIESNWFGTEYLQEPHQKKAAAEFRAKGVACGNCCVTSITLSVLEHKAYNDISGNNINHPNDFWARIYACTLFEDLIGYGNLS